MGVRTFVTACARETLQAQIANSSVRSIRMRPLKCGSAPTLGPCRPAHADRGRAAAVGLPGATADKGRAHAA
eukprot:6204956-Pleurochrysis_carterae.AAC.5